MEDQTAEDQTAVMTTSSCWVRGYNSTPSPTVQSTPVNRTVQRASDPTRGSRHDFPSGRPGRTLLFSCCSSPWPHKEFDWNGDVATRVDCVPQRLDSLRNIYPKG